MTTEIQKNNIYSFTPDKNFAIESNINDVPVHSKHLYIKQSYIITNSVLLKLIELQFIVKDSIVILDLNTISKTSRRTQTTNPNSSGEKYDKYIFYRELRDTRRRTAIEAQLILLIILLLMKMIV